MGAAPRLGSDSSGQGRVSEGLRATIRKLLRGTGTWGQSPGILALGTAGV